MSFRHSGPPKNPALPDSVASAEVPGPRRLTAKFNHLQKPATNCRTIAPANGSASVGCAAKTPGPRRRVGPWFRHGHRFCGYRDCFSQTRLGSVDITTWFANVLEWMLLTHHRLANDSRREPRTHFHPYSRALPE
jgi:hypothetical protein